MIDLKFKTVTLTGFRSFKDEAIFKLDREPGLYFIGGNNLDDPRLGGNGAGKSSLFDSITWCLFGKTVRGLRGAVLKNGQSKTCSVKLDFEKDGDPYTITRTQAPNSLTISPPLVENNIQKEVISQEDIDKFLNITYDKFLYAWIVGQFSASFLDLGATDKLNLFSDIMSLTLWERCAKSAATIATDYENRNNLLEAKRDGIQSKAEALKADLGRLEASSEGFEKTRQSQLQTLTKMAQSLFAENTELEKEEKDFKKVLDSINFSIETTEEDIKRITSNIEHIDSDINKVHQLIAIAASLKSAMTTEFNKWKSLDTCPYCKQEVETKIVNGYKTKATKELLLYNKQLKQFDSQIEDLQKQRKVNTDKLSNTKNTANLEARSNTSQNIADIITHKRLKQQELRQTRQSMDSLRDGKNPYAELIVASQTQINSVKKELLKIEEDLAENNKLLLGNQFWIKGFKELRLWIVSDALSALEVESNNALAKLGLSDWKLKFQMERETTTGGLSKGFHVFVYPKHAKEDTYVPFEVWSGGESQRLKLAAIVGLMSLIQNYKGIVFNISVWDEPSSYLSEEGIEDLIKFLREEATHNKKVIYMIDHRNLQNPNFRGSIQIEKTKEGSHIIDV